MANVFVDLVLDTGDLVRISCPSKFEDDLHDSLENTRKRGDRWSSQQWDGCTAEFMGMNLTTVNMSRVVGTL